MGEMYVSPPVYKIPDEYQGVEYLQTDGTAYISTDFYPTNNSKVVVKVSNFNVANEGESDLKLLGCRSSSSENAFTLWILAAKISGESKLQPCLLRGQFSDTINEYIQLGDGESGYEYPQLINWDENTVFTLTLDSSGLTIQYTNTNNEEINVTYALQATPTVFTSLYSLVLFGTNTADEISTAGHSFKIHECLLYEENKLVRWYYPCYKIQNNKNGIYDIISQKFYTNEEGNFSIGNPVESPEYIAQKKDIPNDYYTIDWIQQPFGDGYSDFTYYKPYIDTGIKPTINTKVIFKGKIVIIENTIHDGTIFGSQYYNSSHNWNYNINYYYDSKSKKRLEIIVYTYDQNSDETFYFDIENKNYEIPIKIEFIPASKKLYLTILNENNEYNLTGPFTATTNYPNLQLIGCSYSGQAVGWSGVDIKLNHCKIFESDTLIRNFYPVLEKSTLKPGVYDIVNKLFYSNGNTYEQAEEFWYSDIDYSKEKLLYAQKVSKAYIPHGIPPEYQQLEWIQASSNLVLDSGYIPNYKTEIYGKFSNVSSYGSITGIEVKENSTFGFWLTYTESSNFNGRYDSTWNNSDEFSINTDDIIEIILNRHSWEIKQNGTSIYSIQKTRSVFNLSENLFILSVNVIENNEQSYWSHGGNFKIYSFQIKEDGRLLRDYYPVKRKSDEVYGLYDVIQQQFYLPISGSFSCSDEVIIHNTLKARQVHKVYGSVNNVAKLIKTYPYLPKEYQQVEYIDTAGNTVLDLGFIANENTGFDIDFIQYKNVTTSGYGTIFGARQSTSARRYVLSSYNGGIWDYGSATRLQKQGMAKNSRQFYSYRYNAFLRPNNTIATVSSTAAFTTPGNLTLFSLHNTSSTSQIQNGDVRIYSLKFYNRYNKVNDYYPCYRLSDGVVGLYDIVSKQFLTKNAGAALTKGENIIKKL